MSTRKKHTFTLSEAAKKKLVLNLPYCMIGLYATKLGQAWRMAEGTNLSEKLLHLGDGFTSAFASSLPSFHPADLLVGLLAGLLLRLAVYLKSKDAKKFRKGREYGSARWGTRKDIEPFIDPVFKNNILLTQTERLTMNSRPKDPRTARNKNVLVIGGSGSGKTRYLLKPNLMQCHSSYVITDPKGILLIECGHLLEKKKYQIRFFNTINFKKSLHYNPFHYIHSEKDILKLANVLITNTDGGQKSGDPFWRNAEMLLYCALMGYIFYEAPPHEQNFNTLVAMINAMEVREDDDNFKNPVDLLFDALEEKDPDHFAVRQYHTPIHNIKMNIPDFCTVCSSLTQLIPIRIAYRPSMLTMNVTRSSSEIKPSTSDSTNPSSQNLAITSFTACIPPPSPEPKNGDSYAIFIFLATLR